MSSPKVPKFTLLASKIFVKDLKKLPKKDQIRVREALFLIQEDPYGGRKVVGASLGKYRWRIGGYRLCYDIEGNTIQVLRVVKREDAYRKF